MKLFLILATAATLAAAGSRSYRSEPHRYRELERRPLDYDDIQTADQDEVERFEEPTERSDSNRKSSRTGQLYSAVHSIQVSKSKAQRRHSKVSSSSAKDSEASGSHFEGAHYGSYGAVGPQVQQIHTHELLTSQGLVPLYQTGPGGHGGGNIVLTGGLGGLGVPGLGEHGGHPLLVAGGGAHGHHPGLIANGPHAHAHAVGPHPHEDHLGTDVTKSVYVFSAPPDPFDYVPRQTIARLPQKPQKHYQVVFINAPTPPPPQQHHVEIPPPPELKTLVYVLVKKPERPPPINFIKSPPLPHHQHKPEVYFIRYKNRGYGLGPSPHGPPVVDEPIPVGHPGGLSYAPIAAHPHEELRGNIDYGPSLQHPQYHEGPAPYELDEYQDDSHLAASQVLGQRSSVREVDAGVSGI